MGKRGSVLHAAGALVVLVTTTLVSSSAGAGGSDHANQAAGHWTAERKAAALPRDLAIDERGLGYMQRRDGSLEPYGHSTPASPSTRAKPGGGSDTTGPTISTMQPANGATIGSAQAFSALVIDASGVRSVTFTVVSPGGASQSFAGARSGDTWSVNLSGFTNGSWTWRVVARDAAKGAGNTSTSATLGFTVDTGGGGGGGGGGGVVADAPWTAGGAVQTAAGRIYFEMPANSRKTRWNGYVCSGTTATDGITGRSVIITAAHCVYDDVYKAFARNVLFIPDQDHSTGSTDQNCANDPLGCWLPTFGVVDVEWTTRTFPANEAWDYAYYVVPDTGAHAGTAASSDVLDLAGGSLAVQFTAPTLGDVTHALGYSYSDDPNFMYCAEAMGTEGAVNWWLPSCGLSGGSSGGPWVQPMDEASGSGPIISVNSWGYTNEPGMAGPKLSGTSASCVFTRAKTALLSTVGGIAASC